MLHPMIISTHLIWSDCATGPAAGHQPAMATLVMDLRGEEPQKQKIGLVFTADAAATARR